jgi:hypothetical protein
MKNKKSPQGQSGEIKFPTKKRTKAFGDESVIEFNCKKTPKTPKKGK